MKYWRGGVAALSMICVALGQGLTAHAGDFVGAGPDPYAPTPVSRYDWSGAYFGVNLGYQWARATSFGVRFSGAAGGVQGGYNWQVGQFVFGGETDLQLSDAHDTFAAWQFSNPWFGSIRGRAGFAMNNVLFYATAGLAYGGLELQFAGASEKQTQFGFTGGAGVEVGFAQNWSARAEYLFTDFSDRGYVLTRTSNGFDSNLLRLGVNYRF